MRSRPYPHCNSHKNHGWAITNIRFGMDISHRSYDGPDQSHAIELLRQDQSVAERIRTLQVTGSLVPRIPK